MPSACSFGSVTNGSLSLNGAGTSFVTAGDGQVTMTCNQAASLAISAPVQVSNGAPVFSFGTGDSAESSVTVGSGDADNGSSTTDDTGVLPITVAGTKVLSVSMSAASSATILPGNYQFSVTLTATP